MRNYGQKQTLLSNTRAPRLVYLRYWANGIEGEQGFDVDELTLTVAP